jgi:hypothetical protein
MSLSHWQPSSEGNFIIIFLHIKIFNFTVQALKVLKYAYYAANYSSFQIRYICAPDKRN